MPYVLIITLVLHVLTIVFWAGSTFTLTRIGGDHAARLFRPQMGAAALAIITGMILWNMLHKGPFGVPEQILAVGAVSALLAAGVQGALVGPARRKLAHAGDVEAVRGRMMLGNRIAAGLLAIALIAMTSVRFA